jgi:DtxR family Mn-dependent transcriptional regulator
MNLPLPDHLSESEEMYLVSVVRIQETSGRLPVPISKLARELQVLPVSANQMVRKLADNGFITYTPYKGVALTDTGARLALHILRHRRLWEVFLVDRLGYTPIEAQSLACRLEHTLPAEAAERLANFLGSPVSNPLGEPIPGSDQPDSQPGFKPLSQAPTGARVQLGALQMDMVRRSFLLAQGVSPGTMVQVLARGSSGDLLLGLDDGHVVHLADELVQAISIAAPGE